VNPLPYIGILACATVIEIGWIAAVRLVTSDSVSRIVVMAMAMQAISYCSTLILVSDHWTMASGVLGSGLGALIGMRVPARWIEKSPK
jgi:hypothetical protein